MKTALSVAIFALLLVPAPMWAQPTPKPCFSIVLDLQMRQANDAGTNETHHPEIVYRPGMAGDNECRRRFARQLPKRRRGCGAAAAYCATGIETALAATSLWMTTRGRSPVRAP